MAVVYATLIVKGKDARPGAGSHQAAGRGNPEGSRSRDLTRSRRGGTVCLSCILQVEVKVIMTINAGEFLIAFVAAMGIPSAIMGFIVWKLERKIAARDKRAEEQEEAQKEFFLLMVQSTGAAIALGEATAKAVQRIPDANCNGDMHDALNYAANIKHKQKDFLTKQGIHAMYD